MKRTFTRTLSLLIALAATSAQAVPIHFDFSGRVSGGSIGSPGIGTEASGGFRFESDRLVSMGSQNGIQYSFLDWQPAVTGPLAFMDVGGVHYEVPNGSQNYAYVNFVDGCQPLCNLGWAEDFILGANSSEQLAPGFTGTFRSTFLSLTSLYRTTQAEYPYGYFYDQFVGAEMAPLDTLRLPLGVMQAGVLDNWYTCVEGQCQETSTVFYTVALDTVTRGSGSQTVPEPGTLTLLGLGLAGIAAARRKRKGSDRQN